LSVLDDLTQLLIPPADPLAPGSPDEWAQVEQRLGTELPSDYKAFISRYGAGTIDDWFVWVLSPFSPATPGNLEHRLAEHREEHGFNVQYFDEPDGLIPWADNADRGMAFWETHDSDPQRWTVVTVVEDYIQRWPENMTTFLRKVLLREHLSVVFGNQDQSFDLPLQYHPIPR
jgi:hypothetical protein